MAFENILLSSAYFAPVHYFARYNAHSNVFVEKFENFNKQTYRNRCVILGGNGPITLVVPVVKSRAKKILIKDLKVSYDVDWQRNHWRTIFSAYNSSPYFEYYADDIIPFFKNKQTFLFDLNLAIHEMICELIEIENKTKLTEDFEKTPANTLNFRDIISPKNKDLTDEMFQPENYTQVFSEKFDFVPDLSILDLLFNEGPNSLTILENSLKTIEKDS